MTATPVIHLVLPFRARTVCGQPYPLVRHSSVRSRVTCVECQQFIQDEKKFQSAQQQDA
jgi:hypothetical protein